MQWEPVGESDGDGRPNIQLRQRKRFAAFELRAESTVRAVLRPVEESVGDGGEGAVPDRQGGSPCHASALSTGEA